MNKPIDPKTKEGWTRKKKCAKCGQLQELANFGLNPTSSDGYKSYCKSCTNKLGARRRHVNISFRLRHHIVTRVLKQLEAIGQQPPDGLLTNLEQYLGYRISELRTKLNTELQEKREISLRDAIGEGYHLDHIKPLSSFTITGLDCQVFRDCWAISNLEMIPAADNLKKGANYNG